jgi:hypothetical protein
MCDIVILITTNAAPYDGTPTGCVPILTDHRWYSPWLNPQRTC